MNIITHDDTINPYRKYISYLQKLLLATFKTPSVWSLCMSSNMLDEPVKKFIHKKVVILDSDQTVEKAAKTMRDEQTGSILVSDKNEAVGIITERDILYNVVAGG